MVDLGGEERWALVLAGGDGRRLQQLTQALTGAPIPKQYCRIVGEQSLLQATLMRTGYWVPSDRTLIIVNRDHLDIARDQLRALPPHSLVVQPHNRDTGPGLLLSLFHLARRTTDATVAVFPSDHYVGDDQGFISHVSHAARIIDEFPDKVVLLGIPPDRCERGLGYVEPSAPLRASAGAGAFHVTGFQEKPSMARARSLLARGGLWNSFVMVFRLRRLLALLEAVVPTEYKEMQALATHPARIAEHYQALRPWNFSTAFLARIPEHLVVLRVENVPWSDWGTPESIARTLKRLKQRVPWRAYKPSPAAA